MTSNEKKAVVSVTLPFTENQVTNFVTKFKETETHFKNWITKPPLAVEAAMATVNNGVFGAAISYVLDTICLRICSVLPLPPPLKATLRTPLMEAHEFGVMVGVDAGITCVMKNIRGKEDVQTRLVAGFGAGVMFSLVRRQHPAIVISSGVFLALLEVVMFKVLEKFKGPKKVEN